MQRICQTKQLICSGGHRYSFQKVPNYFSGARYFFFDFDKIENSNFSIGLLNKVGYECAHIC